MIVVIPARYGSTRLHGKALLPINGKPLVQHVYQCAVTSSADRVIIATDHETIREAAEKFGAEVCMTSTDHTSGTERLAEAISSLDLPDDQVVVNLQGDEPMMPASIIDQVANTLEQTSSPMATACHEIDSAEEIRDPNVVKVVVDKQGNAVYFSRAAIPFLRDDPGLNSVPSNTYFRHIGIYAYRAGFVKKYVSWPACELERHESLEQLRVLYNGDSIAVYVSSERPGPGVDTQADLDKIRSLMG